MEPEPNPHPHCPTPAGCDGGPTLGRCGRHDCSVLSQRLCYLSQKSRMLIFLVNPQLYDAEAEFQARVWIWARQIARQTWAGTALSYTGSPLHTRLPSDGRTCPPNPPVNSSVSCFIRAKQDVQSPTGGFQTTKTGWSRHTKTQRYLGVHYTRIIINWHCSFAPLSLPYHRGFLLGTHG